MTKENADEKPIADQPRKKVLALALGLSVIVATTCFVVLALLPEQEGPPLKDPLRSLLTGVGVLAVASPLCIAGFILKKRSADSPYFEGTFIATVLNVFGFVCVAVGLACILLGLYDLAVRLLDTA